MSQPSQTQTNTSAEPKLCKMGCGFFGSNATGDCCSKCWNEMKKQGPDTCVEVAKKSQEVQPTPMEIDSQPAPKVEVETPTKTPTQTTAPKKKKKKKTSYKSMMAGMMQSTEGRDVEKEKESLRKVTGGGNFTKIEKI